MKPFSGPRGGDDAFGTALNSQAHRLNKAMSTAPQSLEQISAISGVSDIGRIRGHMQWLRERGWAEAIDGLWALKPHAADLLQSQASGGSFITYTNTANKHVTIHAKGCSQVGKKGGTHKHGQGWYHEHATFSEARHYAESTGLPVVNCSFCEPFVAPVIHEAVESGRLPEEAPRSANLAEGAVCQRVVNAYERNPRARKECIETYGTCCCICGFDFGKVYGAIAEGYIHIHHLRPLSEIGEEYQIEPKKDLRPVCPNCHAVVHLRTPPYSIDEVRELLQ